MNVIQFVIKLMGREELCEIEHFNFIGETVLVKLCIDICIAEKRESINYEWSKKRRRKVFDNTRIIKIWRIIRQSKMND